MAAAARNVGASRDARLTPYLIRYSCWPFTHEGKRSQCHEEIDSSMANICMQSLSRIHQIVSRFLSSFSLASDEPQRHQYVIVMRHGERMDNFAESWLSEAARPWDPPLVRSGPRAGLPHGLGAPDPARVPDPPGHCLPRSCDASGPLLKWPLLSLPPVGSPILSPGLLCRSTAQRSRFWEITNYGV